VKFTQTVTFLTRIREVLDSNLGQVTAYPDWRLASNSLAPLFTSYVSVQLKLSLTEIDGVQRNKFTEVNQESTCLYCWGWFTWGSQRVLQWPKVSLNKNQLFCLSQWRTHFLNVQVSFILPLDRKKHIEIMSLLFTLVNFINEFIFREFYPLGCNAV
jgi:hypothetical protein